MKCLIIAAGRGKRLAHKGGSKPLAPVLGVPLIERVIRSAAQGGMDDFYVVTGYQGDRVSRFLDTLSRRCGIRITTIPNDQWDRENGLSVLKAEKFLTDRFALVMSDHLFDPSLLSDIKDMDLGPDEIILAVDRNRNNPLIDIDDVTKVRIRDGKVTDIGKDLSAFNAFDTGIFLCSPAIFSGISESIDNQKDSSLTGGVRCLAKAGKVRVFDIGSRFWIDVDDEMALNRAENALLSDLGAKHTDGPVSRYLNRPLSRLLSRRLAPYPVTPNQISLASFLLSLIAAALFCMPHYAALAGGGLLAQLASIIDGCDGEIARLKFLQSDFGGWFDAVLDRYADGFLLAGLTWYAFSARGDFITLFAGTMALIGSFMVSYTADKHDALLRRRVSGRLRIGRDIRVFMIFAGTLLNQPFWTLVLIAALMNGETVRRIHACRTER